MPSPDRLADTGTLLDTLRTAIVHGELPAGQRLVELELAAQFDASRAAVREAIVLLENEGLVARQRNRGAWVRPVSLAEAVEITEVRAVLEGLCAAKAAVAATAADHEALADLGVAMRAAVRDNDTVAYHAASHRIHARIRSMAGQRAASDVLERLRYRSARYEFSVALLPGRPAEGLQEHLAVIRAITARAPDVAEQAMRTHLFSVVRALHQLADLGLACGTLPES